MNTPHPSPTSTNTERGGIALFIAFLLPILFLAISLIVEITALSHHKNATQTQLDALLVSAAQRLPNAEAARQALMEASPFPPETISVTVRPDSVSTSVSIPQRGSFLTFFGIDKLLSTTVHAEVRIPPLSVVVALDTSSYTAPRGTQTEWRSDSLRAASFFLQDQVTNRSLSPLRRTQACFNDTLLPLKRFAVHTFAALTPISNYTVSAVTFPASLGNHPTMPGLSVIQDQGNPHPYWIDYKGANHSNDDCASAALHDTLYHPDSPYRFAQPRAGSFGGIAPTQERLVDLATGSFNPHYAPFLSTEEVLWSQAAREGDGGSTAQTLDSLGRFLISHLSHSRSRYSDTFVGKESLVALIFAGDIPRWGAERFPAEGIRTKLIETLASLEQQARAAEVTLHFIYLLFPNNTGVTPEEGDALSSFISAASAPYPSVRFSVLMTRSSNELEQTVLPMLKNLQKPVVVAQ